MLSCEYAIPAALQALRLLIEVNGEESPKVIRPYLLLSEAALELGRLELVEEFLSKARWTVVTSKVTDDGLLSSLHRCLGRLQSTRGNHSNAIRSFAADLFHAACCSGAESLQAMPACFHLGTVFAKTGRQREARACFGKVTETYVRELPKMQPLDLNPANTDEIFAILRKIVDFYVQNAANEASKRLQNDQENAQ